MKRQRGRNRGGGGGGKPQQNVNRAFDSNGPDNVKIRGHAQHVFEKYQQLARDAFSSGDRVLAENYLQHADHYFRVLRTIQPQRPAAEILGRDVFASGLDIDFEDENEGQEEAPAEAGGGEAAEPNGERREFEPRRDNGEQGRSGRDYENGRREERYEGRRDNGEARREGGEPRYESRRDNGEARREGGDRGEPRRDYDNRRDYDSRRDRRFEGRRDDRAQQYRDRGESRFEEPRRVEAGVSDPLPVIEPEARPLAAGFGEEVEGSPLLRSGDGGVSEAPAFLQSFAAADDGEARRSRGPRRRRGRGFETEGEAEVDADATGAPEEA